jgi:hypothetical protein
LRPDLVAGARSVSRISFGIRKGLENRPGLDLGVRSCAGRQARGEMRDDLEANLIGMTGRISVPVPVGGAGEIIISIRGGSEAFTAYTLGDEALPRNARAAVVDKTGARTVLVTGV